MIKKLIDTKELMFLEISDIELVVSGKHIEDMVSIQPPVFAVLVLDFIREEDSDIDECISNNPGMYESMIFPLNGKVYAAIFPITLCEKAFSVVRKFIEDTSAENLLDMAYAYDFNSLDKIEDFIKSRVITKTEKSALYKMSKEYCYVTNSALIGLSEFFIEARCLSMAVLNEHGEVLISDDAYDKILSYIF